MTKPRVLSGTDVCRIPAAEGFEEVRRRGSHAIMQKRNAGSTITVPVPMHRTLRRETLMSIVRQSGLPRAMFEAGT